MKYYFLVVVVVFEEPQLLIDKHFQDDEDLLQLILINF
jgi:hypothetical protein